MVVGPICMRVGQGASALEEHTESERIKGVKLAAKGLQSNAFSSGGGRNLGPAPAESRAGV